MKVVVCYDISIQMESRVCIVDSHDEKSHRVSRTHSIGKYIDHFKLGYPISLGTRNLGCRIRCQILQRDSCCRICDCPNVTADPRQGTVKLEVCHLFSNYETGKCYDGTLKSEFINSIDNAALMCRKCSCLLGEILLFLTNKTNAPNQKHKFANCYFCDQFTLFYPSYKNTTSEWSIFLCGKCGGNLESLLNYMGSHSEMLKTAISKCQPWKK